VKYKHNFALFTRLFHHRWRLFACWYYAGRQTPGELNTNSGRLYEFESIEEVQDILIELSSGEILYKTIATSSRSKEVRYVHLLGGNIDWHDENAFEEPARTSSGGGLEARVAKLEQELAELKEAFDKLMRN